MRALWASVFTLAKQDDTPSRVFPIKMTTLFDTLKLGSLSVPSRIFMVTRRVGPLIF